MRRGDPIPISGRVRNRATPDAPARSLSHARRSKEDLSSWPACAESDEEAEAWWGDLAGSFDPMVDLWITQMDEAGFPVFEPETLEASVAVSNVDGGCYGVARSIRATLDSLMNQNIPVLGSVNRRWADEILDLWEGAPTS